MGLIEYFQSALRQGTQTHFYLIRGKGRLAELIDQIFCEDSFRACGVCRGCRLRRSGNLPDLRWIEGEESIKDEEIEELRAFIIRKPSVSRFKVIAISQAHRLTVRAQNRLLKTLEEPPKDLIFLMETDQPERLLETVLSRAIRLNFSQDADVPSLADLDVALAEALASDDLRKRLEAFKPYRKNKELLREQIPFLIESVRQKATKALSEQRSDTQMLRSLALIDLLDEVDRNLEASGNADFNIERLMLFQTPKEEF